MILICLIVAVSVFLLSVLCCVALSLHSRIRQSAVKPFYILTGGVFLSATVAFFPLYMPLFDSSPVFNALLGSIHNAVRLFMFNCDISAVQEQSAVLAVSGLQAYYVLFFNVLLMVAPILTVGIVLSFFREASAFLRYACRFFRDAYLFSALNDRSLALARSLRKTYGKKALLVFSGVSFGNEQASSKLIAEAAELGAILFKRDITSPTLKLHSKRAKMYFFILGKDERENLDHALHLSADPLQKGQESGYDVPRADTRIYLFSVDPLAKQYLNTASPRYVKLRRVNDVQSLVYRLLYDHGLEIFGAATETGRLIPSTATKTPDKEKKIHALVLGMGLHGTEMVRALSWLAQMHPYRIEIDAFDISASASSGFASAYPDLFDCNPMGEQAPRADGYRCHNGDFETEGEAHYRITIHDGVDVEQRAFDESLVSFFADATYTFISLGNDDRNGKTAIKLRTLFRRMGKEPIIHTVIYNKNVQNALQNAPSPSGEPYGILATGDVAATYSVSCLLNSALEQQALQRHMKYAHHVVAEKGLRGTEKEACLAEAEEAFWKHDYNYRSSTASVIHAKFKRELGIPGSDKAPADRSEDEARFYRILEHKRWNAYVRSEGFVYAPVRDKLAKTHPLLVPFDELPYAEQIKDED